MMQQYDDFAGLEVLDQIIHGRFEPRIYAFVLIRFLIS